MSTFINTGATDVKATVQFAFPPAGILGVSMFYDGPGESGDESSTSEALKGFTQLNSSAGTLAYKTCAAVGVSGLRLWALVSTLPHPWRIELTE
jgi:hypothetical protein